MDENAGASKPRVFVRVVGNVMEGAQVPQGLANGRRVRWSARSPGGLASSGVMTVLLKREVKVPNVQGDGGQTYLYERNRKLKMGFLRRVPGVRLYDQTVRTSRGSDDGLSQCQKAKVLYGCSTWSKRRVSEREGGHAVVTC